MNNDGKATGFIISAPLIQLHQVSGTLMRFPWSQILKASGICDDECACQRRAYGRVRILEAGRRGIVDNARFGLRLVSVSRTA